MSKRQGLLARIFRAASSSWRDELVDALTMGAESASGTRVNSETAMRISTVNACVRIISDTVASLPLQVYKRLDSGGKTLWPTHPLFELLNARPNPWQTSMDWLSQMVNHLLFRGNYYGAILRHGDSIVDDIIPLNPDRVEVEQAADYSLSYEVTLANGTEIVLAQEDVLHIRGLSSNGITGRGVITDAREMFGAALATQEYSGRLFKNDATPGVVIKLPGKLENDAAIRRLKDSWDIDSAGAANSHKTRVLENGATIERMSLSAEDSQFIETRKMQRSEIAALFGVPLMLLQANDNTTTFASAEQFMLSYTMHTIRPWLVRIEQALSRSLFTAPRVYFPRLNLDAIQRADLKTRYEAYRTGRDGGWLSKNDVRSREDMNPIDGGDDYRSLAEIQNANTAGAPDGNQV
jgi:HK97 family phage portal protein